MNRRDDLEEFSRIFNDGSIESTFREYEGNSGSVQLMFKEKEKCIANQGYYLVSKNDIVGEILISVV